MRVDEFEERVWAVEQVRLVLRSPSNADVGDYDFQNAANQTWSVTEWVANRVVQRIGDTGWLVIVGSGQQPPGQTLLSTVRESYGGG